jgi:uncharacterized membrane protein
MDRPALDAFARRHRLTPPAIDAALALTSARPQPTAWRAFAASLLHAAGLGALGAGALFFVAANWQNYGVFGRFALLQVALLGCVGVALWRAPPARAGQAALILATLLTGGLLALFGQSYQTGADLHELFFAWALLALPFALAGWSGALWAVWWAVLNVALALLCGWLGPDHFFWRFVDGRLVDHAVLLMLPCGVNLLGAAAFVAVGRARPALATPPWLLRGLATAAFGYGTAAVIAVVAQGDRFRAPQALAAGGAHAAVVLLFVAISVGLAYATWRRRQDVFPMALIAAAWIAISTTWLATTLRLNDLGAFFLIAAWLVGASTASGLLLMHWVRAWRLSPASDTPGAAA